MGFAKEIEDFLNGYKMVGDMAATADDRKIRKDAAKRAADKDEQADMEGLAVDNEAFLSPSALAAAKRAPKKAKATTSPAATSPATGIDLNIIAPYGDTPGEDDTVAMAAGGVVPDEQEHKMGIPMGGALPKPKPVPPSYPTGNRERSLTEESKAEAPEPYTGSIGPGLKDMFASSTKAIQAAMKSFAADNAAQKPAVGGAEPEIDFTTGKGAATPAEIKAIDTKIDPDGKMDPWSKGRARLAYAYDYFVSRGEPEKAANVSKRILLFDKMASETRGKIAVQLINGGDPDRGAGVLVDAYNENIHDGSTLEVKPTGDGRFSFVISKDGNVVNKGEGTAAQLAELAGNVANGSEFTRRTSRIAAGDDPATPPAEAAPGTAAANPPQGIPDTAASPDPAAAAPATPAQPAADSAAPADAAPAAEEPAKPKGPRNIAWAKKQYSYAASVAKSWEDEVAKNPTPENKARLKDAQIRLSEAEQDAIAIRMSTVKSKTADQSKIMIDFDDDLAKWREAADPLAALPGVPKDGLRGQPKAAEGAIPAGAAPAAAQPAVASPVKENPRDANTSFWFLGDGQQTVGPKSSALKPATPELLGQAKAALAAGKSRAGVLRMLLENGYNPTGL